MFVYWLTVLYNISGNSKNNSNKKKLAGVLIGIGILFLVTTIVGYFIYLRRKKLRKSGEFWDIYSFLLFFFFFYLDTVNNYKTLSCNSSFLFWFILNFFISSLLAVIYLKKYTLNHKSSTISGRDTTINHEDHIDNNDKESIDLPTFDFSTIANATNNFSPSNKLGEGGYGPVYKVTWLDIVPFNASIISMILIFLGNELMINRVH